MQRVKKRFLKLYIKLMNIIYFLIKYSPHFCIYK